MCTFCTNVPQNSRPLDPKEIVTVEEIAISNMLEIEALRQLLFEKGIITTKDTFTMDGAYVVAVHWIETEEMDEEDSED